MAGPSFSISLKTSPSTQLLSLWSKINQISHSKQVQN